MDKEKMIMGPEVAFKTVANLVNDTNLTKEEKIKALYNWKFLCELLKESTNEGMPGERTTPLAEVLEALRTLEG